MTFSIQDVTQIISSGEKQLRVIECYLQCLDEKFIKDADYFIDKNKHMRVSDALMLAVDTVSKELSKLQEAIHQIDELVCLIFIYLNNLSWVIFWLNFEAKKNFSQVEEPRKSHSNKIKYGLMIGGIAVVIVIVCKLYRSK